MKKIIVWIFLLILGIAFASWADDMKLPPPPPTDDLSAPLPPDLNQTTPLPLENDQKTPVSTEPQPTVQPPVEPTSISKDSSMDILPPPLAPTATPVKKSLDKVKEPQATPMAEELLEAPSSSGPEITPAEEASPSAETGGVADYFPASPGTRRVYQYLKWKKTRTVECVGREPMPNGAIRVALKAHEDGKLIRDRYSLHDNKLEHISAGNFPLKGHFLIQLPAPGKSRQWDMTGSDGLPYHYKASFGKAEVGNKTYPDCVIVEEKEIKDKKVQGITYFYYAKGVGLVSVEAYSPSMKKRVSFDSMILVDEGKREASGQ